jgi:NAD(P)-dependent dehydrogenase (short-subunit alcohol dehydrogenase family)
MKSYNPFSLEGKIILVTGSSSGIGRAIAIECSRMGARLIISGRDQKRLDETFSMLEGKGHRSIIMDITTDIEKTDFLRDIGQLNGVVHAAGIIKRVPLKMVSKKAFQEILEVNLLAPAMLTRQLYKEKLLQSQSSIVFISSVGSHLASPGNTMYMASKGGVNSFMRGSALELAGQSVRVNCIEPAMVKTNLTKSLSDEDIEKDLDRYPLKRYGLPEEIAYAAIYLLSDASAWMTGSFITLDGGLSLR